MLAIRGLSKTFGDKLAVNQVDLDVPTGSFYGIVGPNGAGKTTILSMATGLMVPDAGTVWVSGQDVWADPARSKRGMGILPDGMRTFDRLTGAQLLFYSGGLRGLDRDTILSRSADLLRSFDLESAAGKLVADYSAGMRKKITLASVMIHAPRLLVLDEPFESVDPVSSANIIDILHAFRASGGTVVMSSHVMDLVQRVCDHVAVIVDGTVRDQGTVEQVRQGKSLQDRFVELAGGRHTAGGLEWLHTSSS